MGLRSDSTTLISYRPQVKQHVACGTHGLVLVSPFPWLFKTTRPDISGCPPSDRFVANVASGSASIHNCPPPAKHFRANPKVSYPAVSNVSRMVNRSAATNLRVVDDFGERLFGPLATGPLDPGCVRAFLRQFRGIHAVQPDLHSIHTKAVPINNFGDSP